MELKFQYTEKKWVGARRKFLFLTKVITKLQLAVLAAFTFITAFLLIADGVNAYTVVMAAAAALYIVMVFFLYYVQPVWIFRNTGKYYSEYKLSFQREQIQFETQGVSSALDWKLYTSCIENEKYYYLIQGKGMYFMLPKRVFSSEGQERQFKELLREHIPEQQKKV